MVSNPARCRVEAALPRLSTLRLCFCSSLQMMQFAWQSYKRYAMGKNELRPLTRDGYEGNMFGELTSGDPLPLGAEQCPCSGTVLLLAFCLLSGVPPSPDLEAPKCEFLRGCLGC